MAVKDLFLLIEPYGIEIIDDAPDLVVNAPF